MFLERELRREREAREARRAEIDRRAAEVYRRARTGLDASARIPDTPALPNPRGERLERGVYLAPFVSRHGFDVWFAVDSRHRCIKTLEVTPDRTERLVKRVLRGILNQYDPVAELRVV